MEVRKLYSTMVAFFIVFALISPTVSNAQDSEVVTENAYSTYDELHRDTNATLNPYYKKNSFNDVGIITPMWDSYTYSVESEAQRKFENWSLVHNNADDVADSVTYSVAISQSASITLGGEVEFKALVAKGKFTANTTVGVNSTTSVNITWNLPKGKWRLSAGAMYNKLVGYKEYRINGSVISKEKITADYTFDKYSDQQKVNY